MSSNDIFHNIGANGYVSELMDGTIWWSGPNPDYFTVNHYYGGTDADFDFFVHTGPKRKKAIMSDCVHIFLIGPQGSGKTTLAKELERRGYEQIIAYTTRPPRDNEIEGVDYHFVTDAEFEDAFLDGELTCADIFHRLWRAEIRIRMVGSLSRGG